MRSRTLKEGETSITYQNSPSVSKHIIWTGFTGNIVFFSTPGQRTVWFPEGLYRPAAFAFGVLLTCTSPTESCAHWSGTPLCHIQWRAVKAVLDFSHWTAMFRVKFQNGVPESRWVVPEQFSRNWSVLQVVTLDNWNGTAGLASLQTENNNANTTAFCIFSRLFLFLQ